MDFLLLFGLIVGLFVGSFIAFALADEFCKKYGKNTPESLILTFKFLVGVSYGMWSFIIIRGIIA